jgi:hypothetical protein
MRAILILALLATGLAFAKVPDRDWPSVVPTPILDVPMQDPAITRGPDGTYYLTGTLQGEGADGKPDFDNCKVIKLWKSKDLKTWEEIGVVSNLNNPGGNFELGGRWMRQSHKDPSDADSPVVHGFKAPELHYIRGGWYICFSVNDQGTGLLKSTSGKPEGPYVPVGQITIRYGDASMFWDEKDEWGGDGSVYWLWGGGWIAKMKDDLSGLAERPRLLQPAHQQEAAWTKRTRLEFPLSVGDHGVFLFKNRGRYYLTAAERTNRFNASCDDTFVAVADKLYGPYGQRQLMLPHGGGVTVFRGPRSSAVPNYYYPQQRHFLNSVAKGARPIEEIEKAKGDPTLYATFGGNDVRARLRNRAAFVPLEWTGPERWAHGFCDFESTPRKPQCVITERGPWPWMVPLLGDDERCRDIHVVPAPEGGEGGHGARYYFGGSDLTTPGKLFLWRSNDLSTWEKFGPLWTYEQIEWIKEKNPYPDPDKVFPGNPKAEIDWKHIFWHTHPVFWKGECYVIYSIFDNDNPKRRGTGALKSKTGRAEGPYESIGWIAHQFGKHPGPCIMHLFPIGDKLYCYDWKFWKPVVAEADLTRPGWKFDWKFADRTPYGGMSRMDPGAITSVADVPLVTFTGSGRLDLKERRHATNYDWSYIVAESPWGPARKDLRPRCVPHCAAANRFRDAKGYWWSSYFGSDHEGPWWEAFGLVALRVKKLPDGDLLIDVEDTPDEYQKKVMGGGAVAEVKTVRETLE